MVKDLPARFLCSQCCQGRSWCSGAVKTLRQAHGKTMEPGRTGCWAPPTPRLASRGRWTTPTPSLRPFDCAQGSGQATCGPGTAPVLSPWAAHSLRSGLRLRVWPWLHRGRQPRRRAAVGQGVNHEKNERREAHERLSRLSPFSALRGSTPRPP